VVTLPQLPGEQQQARAAPRQLLLQLVPAADLGRAPSQHAALSWRAVAAARVAAARDHGRAAVLLTQAQWDAWGGCGQPQEQQLRLRALIARGAVA
jgi:hypothetical protein